MRPYIWVLASMSLAAFAGAASAAQASPEQIVRRVFETFNRHDLEAMAALYSPDAEIMSPDQATPLRGPAGIRAEHGPLFARFPDIADRITSLTVQGDRVAVEFVSRGCSADEPTRCFELPIACFMTVRRGLIIRDATYFDVPSDDEK